MRHSPIAITSVAALALAGAAQAANPHAGGHGNAGGRADTHIPNSHASDRAMEVHRMLANGQNPGHAYGRTDTDTDTKAGTRTRTRAGKTRGGASTSANTHATTNTRVRGASDTLAANTHASARGVERGSMSTTHATADHTAKASTRTKKPSRK